MKTIIYILSLTHTKYTQSRVYIRPWGVLLHPGVHSCVLGNDELHGLCMHALGNGNAIVHMYWVSCMCALGSDE